VTASAATVQRNPRPGTDSKPATCSAAGCASTPHASRAYATTARARGCSLQGRGARPPPLPRQPLVTPRQAQSSAVKRGQARSSPVNPRSTTLAWWWMSWMPASRVRTSRQRRPSAPMRASACGERWRGAGRAVAGRLGGTPEKSGRRRACGAGRPPAIPAHYATPGPRKTPLAPSPQSRLPAPAGCPSPRPTSPGALGCRAARGRRAPRGARGRGCWGVGEEGARGAGGLRGGE
jgi:hypothetical protein